MISAWSVRDTAENTVRPEIIPSVLSTEEEEDLSTEAEIELETETESSTEIDLDTETMPILDVLGCHHRYRNDSMILSWTPSTYPRTAFIAHGNENWEVLSAITSISGLVVLLILVDAYVIMIVDKDVDVDMSTQKTPS